MTRRCGLSAERRTPEYVTNSVPEKFPVSTKRILLHCVLSPFR